MPIEIQVVADADALAREAARVVSGVVAKRPDAVVLAATGNTPIGCYAELARLRATGSLDTSRMRVAQLDEYLGLAADDARSLYGWLDRTLLTPLGIGSQRVVRLPVEGSDHEAAARAYDAAIEAVGGIDLAILGLGPNGHLGFNEPPASADAPTRVISLAPETLASNAGYWRAGTVPERAITAGMSVILSARRVLLLVSGTPKAAILDRMLRTAPDAALPASHLHGHPDTILIADRDARPAGSLEA